MNKNKIYYLLLGVGLGIIITSSMNIAFNKSGSIEYTDEQIKEKAENLGMISIKDNIKKNEQLKEESNSKTQVEKKVEVESKLEENKENNKELKSQEKIESGYKSFVIDDTDTASSIIHKLKVDKIIDDENKFKDLVIKNNLQRKFRTGTYEIKENSTYAEVLKKLIKEEELKNAGFL